MKKYTYPVIIIDEKDNGYSAIFPDLNHLSTCGEELEETLDMVHDCLKGYIESELEDGHELPVPTKLEDIDLHSEETDEYKYEDSDATITLVSIVI